MSTPSLDRAFLEASTLLQEDGFLVPIYSSKNATKQEKVKFIEQFGQVFPNVKGCLPQCFIEVPMLMLIKIIKWIKENGYEDIFVWASLEPGEPYIVCFCHQEPILLRPGVFRVNESHPCQHAMIIL